MGGVMKVYIVDINNFSANCYPISRKVVYVNYVDFHNPTHYFQPTTPAKRLNEIFQNFRMQVQWLKAQTFSRCEMIDKH